MKVMFRLLSGLGWALAALAPVRAQTATAAPWTHMVRSGDIVFFAFAAPARVERYDLAGEQWLTAIDLTQAPTALHVDAEAIYVANDRALLQRALDGTNEQPLHNSAGTITGVLSDADTVFVFTPGYSTNRIDSLRKSDGQYVATWTGTYSISAGFSLAPTQRRIYGVNTATTSFATIELAYNANGTFGTTTELWGDGSFSDRPRTWVAPGERTLVRSNGVVYATPNLTVRGSLAGGIDDAAWHGADVLVVLRGNRLVAFDNAYLESGGYTLPFSARGIAIRTGQVFAFAEDLAAASGMRVTKVAVSAFTAAQPGAAIDPALLSFVPDEVLPVEDGSLLLLSRRLQSIFRWSPATRAYTGSYPLLGAPAAVAYSAPLRRIYLGYSSGAITQIRLDGGSTVETPFANLTAAAGQLHALDDLLFVAEGGSYYSFRIFDRDGVRKHSTDSGGYNNSFLWSSGQRRLYYLSGSSLGYWPVDAAGVMGQGASGPYDWTNTLTTPIRLASDGSRILGANGLVFRTSDLAYGGALSNAVIDATSRAGNWVSIRSAGSATQLQTWTSALFFDRGLTIPGIPFRIFAQTDGRLVVLTTSAGDPSGGYSTPRNDGRLIFSVVDLGVAGSAAVTTSPLIATEPVGATFYLGRAGSLSVVAQGASLSYQWRKNGAAITGATQATFSVAAAQEGDAGSYAVQVSNPFGSALSAAATVIVQEPPAVPVITQHPTSTAVSLGSYVSFTVGATGSGLTYQWRRNSAAISGATYSTFSISGVTVADYASYDVVVANGGGVVTSSAATLSVPVAPVITAQPQAQNVTPGGAATFSVSASGAPAPSYRWQRQAAGTVGFVNLNYSGNYAGVYGNEITVSGATLAMSGDRFRCVAYNGTAPDATSEAATLTVSAAPVFTSAPAVAFLAGLPGSFIVQATGTPVPTFSASGLPSWAALHPVTGVLSGTPPSLTGSPFSILITANNGVLPNALQQFSLSVVAATGIPVITAQPVGQSVGEGVGVTLAVIASGAEPLTYQWRKDNVPIAGATGATHAIAGVTPADAGRYSVVVSNGAGSATSQSVLLSVVPAGVAAEHAIVGRGYMPGGPLTVNNTLNYSGPALSVGWQVLIPDGWSYLSGSGQEGEVKPGAGATGLLEWAWTGEPAGPVAFSYTVQVPAGQTGDRQLAALVTLRQGGTPVQLLARPDPLVVRRNTVHAADADGDGRINLFELTRMIELYNTRNGTTRTGCYRVDAAGEDGFAADSARAGGVVAVLALYHSADSNCDGRISLVELTRVIELFNFRSGTTRTGQYRALAGTEDGYAPGP